MAETALKIPVSHNVQEIIETLRLTAREAASANARASNRTATGARADAARGLAKQYGGALKIGTIKGRIRLKRATRRDPVAVLTFSGRRFALFGNFGMRTVGKWGVRFRRLPWRVETISGESVSAEMLARAFRQRVRSSGRASVFARRTKARASAEILVAPGVARAVAERNIGAALKRAIGTRFPAAFRQEANFLLGKRNARAAASG